jgi:CheY-like chemotaxis protein
LSDVAGVAPDPSGYTVVVGPEGIDRAWIETALLRGGLSVTFASEADILATPHFEPGPRLLVLDDAGGREARGASLRRLHAHPGLKGVPTLVLAYDADIESFTDAITRGVAAYLVKPVSAEELVQVAKRLSGWAGASGHTERRRRLRRPLIMKVEVQVRSRDLHVMGQIVDVSGGGCRIELPAALDVGEAVRIILQGHEGSTHVALGAEVRWYRQAPDGTHVAGLRFTGTTALLAGKILGFISSGMT